MSTPTRAHNDDFAQLSEPYRRELLAHCYRMLGSIHDAEDAVQQTYLDAWRGYGDFEGRSSLRTWLYRIATRVCLKALEGAGRRPLPSGLGQPGDDTGDLPARRALVSSWLQPAPDALFAGDPMATGSGTVDTATIVESRQSMRLAFVAALQHLPARQRAVLILRDVLAWRAEEVASLLTTSTTAVNSALARARTQLRQIGPTEDGLSEPTDPDRRALLDRYATAFTNADIGALTALLTQDVTWEMPPIPTWYAGRDTVLRFLATQVLAAGQWRLVPTRVNGQPALGSYARDSDGSFRAHAIQVPTLTTAGITGIVAFLDPELFPLCGLLPVIHPIAPDPQVTVAPIRRAASGTPVGADVLEHRGRPARVGAGRGGIA
jgi:RNA polymerase sigma-70 factor (ECF subfamily)